MTKRETPYCKAVLGRITKDLWEMRDNLVKWNIVIEDKKWLNSNFIQGTNKQQVNIINHILECILVPIKD